QYYKPNPYSSCWISHGAYNQWSSGVRKFGALSIAGGDLSFVLHAAFPCSRRIDPVWLPANPNSLCLTVVLVANSTTLYRRVPLITETKKRDPPELVGRWSM
ncbi:unnamed protein product, partial [Ectocarpus sp. 6 AP-2014]